MKPWQPLAVVLGIASLALMLTCSVLAQDKKSKEKAKEHKAEHKEKKAEHKEKAEHKAEHKEKAEHKTAAKAESAGSASKAPAGKSGAKEGRSPEWWAHHEAQKKSNEQVAKAYHMLQHAKVKLETIKHSYEGHRQNAVNKIHTAQEHIKKGLGDYGVKMAAAGNAKTEAAPSKTDNEHLAHALETLHKASKILHLANHDYFKQRHEALESTNSAIHELEAARKHEQK